MSFGRKGKNAKPGCVTLRAFHFRVEATPAQSRKLHAALDLGHELRNLQVGVLIAARDAARAAKECDEQPVYLSPGDLKKLVASSQLPQRFHALHSQVRQDISLRVSEGQKRWFEALKEGRPNVRPPGPIARKHFRSLTYPQYGTAAHIKNGRLHLSKLGEFALIGWRKMRGAKKTVTLKWKDGHWWAIVMCEVQERDVCRPLAEVQHLPDAGVDPGLASVLTDSHGTSYETPKPLKNAQARLRHLQKNVSRKFEVRKAQHEAKLAVARAGGNKAPVASGAVRSLTETPYSNRLRGAIRKLARAHTKVANVRLDVARKNARRIERSFSRVAVEEHGLGFMLQNRRWAKSTADVAIGIQKQALKSALGSARYVAAANRRTEGGNSQTCLCGEPVPKTLADRWHSCPACGLQGQRDQVSAIIVQHTSFGGLPNVSAPGLGALELAVKKLETRRGEANGASGESPGAESKRARVPRATSEASAKRRTPRKVPVRNTAGAAQAASAVAETAGHSGQPGWPTEANGDTEVRNRPDPAGCGCSGLQRSHLLQGVE